LIQIQEDTLAGIILA